MKRAKKVFLVHGETNQSEPLAERIKANTGADTKIMKPEVSVEL